MKTHKKQIRLKKITNKTPGVLRQKFVPKSNIKSATAPTVTRLCFTINSSGFVSKYRRTWRNFRKYDAKRSVVNLRHLFSDIQCRLARKPQANHTIFGIQKLAASATYWGMRMLAHRPVRTKTGWNARIMTTKAFSSTPHSGRTRVSHVTPHIYDENPAKRIRNNILWIFFRMRFERFMFKALGCRVYCWFSNLWNAMRGDLTKWQMFEHFAVLRLIKKGMRFTIRENHARVFLKSALLAVSVVGGLSVFMQMLSRMVQSFRSHWAVVMYSIRLLDSCRCFLWYKILVHYRMTVRGKFGGQMRAKQKMFQHGLVKLGAWSLDVAYYRIRPITKYGTFSLRFWLQFRDIKQTRMGNIMTKKGKIIGSLYPNNQYFPG